jgi:hypothetical protein
MVPPLRHFHTPRIAIAGAAYEAYQAKAYCMRNDSTPRQRRGSSDNRPTCRPFSEYLERLADRRAEQAEDLEMEEKYWRNRERLHAEKQELKRAA